MASSHQQQLATSKLLISMKPISRTLARLREKNREFSKFREVLAGKMGISGVRRSRGRARKWLSPFGDSKKNPDRVPLPVSRPQVQA
jgi:hypothetical protein